MCNLKKWIEKAVEGEPVIGVVIGNMGCRGYHLDQIPQESADPKNWYRLLTWEEAIPLIDYEFSNGYGPPGCQCITAWTATKVFFVTQYDGSTAPTIVPRNPIDHVPKMPGG